MQHGRERRGAYKALVGMPKGRRTLERPKRRWKADIEIPRSKMWGMGSIYVALDRDRWRALVEAVKNRRFPHNTGNSLDQLRTCQLHGGSYLVEGSDRGQNEVTERSIY